jgi:UDP-N-acetylmuramyl pentapeptide phosphotransferase/UDP-N-acetylglucosamine-1-phosphate transferase
MESILLNEKNAVLIALVIAAFISWFAIPIVVKVTSIRHLTDRPGTRKIHKREIPTLGGVGLYAGFSFGFLIAVNGYMTGVNYFFLATLLLFLAGMKDDLITLDPKKKLMAEIIAALLLLYFTDIRITNYHGFLGIQAIPAWLTYITTVFIMIVIINAVNLIDGIDGLAASTGIISSAALGFWFWFSGETGYAIMAAALIGTLAGFMRFNLSSGANKIFMGDTGSLLTGFIIAAMTIMFNEVNAGSATYHDLYSAPAISIAILIVPLYDTLRVFTIRIAHHQHPFIADNRHIHHMMLRAGFTHKKADVIIAAAHISIIAMAFALDHIGIFWLSGLLLLTCLLLTGLIYLRIYNRFLLHRVPVGEEDFETIRTIAIMHAHISGRKIRMPEFVPKYNLFNQPGLGDKEVISEIHPKGISINLPVEDKKETESSAS